MKLGHGGRGGFSLVEVLCAILVLGVGIAGLTVGLTTALGTSRESEQQTVAALLAAGRMETLRAESYVVEGEDDGSFDVPDYRWRETITETETEGLYEVTVVVERSDQPVYELKTLLFDPPLTTEEQDDPALKERRRERAEQ